MVFAVSYNGQFIGNAYPTDSGDILLSDVQCGGSEEDIMQCRFATDHSCDHSKDVSVSCYHDADRQSAGQASYL